VTVGGRLTIIGGGVMGLMATASSGLTRSVRNDYRDPAYARLALEARQLRRGLERESGERLLIDCGCLNLVKDTLTPDLVDVAAASGVDTCWYDLVADDEYILGAVPGVPDVYTGVGWRGTGYKFAPWVGKVLAQLSVQRGTVYDIGRFTPARFAGGAPVTGVA
jgi:glycine/D-amino acid oxidase-like deaminating enzyme